MRIALIFFLFAVLAFGAYGYSDYEYSDDYNEVEKDQDGKNDYKMLQSLFKTLNESNFNEVMHNGRQEFGLVFFCASNNNKLCQSFMINFLEMRMLTPNWSAMLKFYNVDCSEKANKELCKKHGFRYAPIFKYYKPQSSNGDLGEKVRSYTNPTVLLTEVLKKINADYPNVECATCPNLKTLPEWIHDPRQIWDMSEHHCVEQVILIPVDSMESLDGVRFLIHVHKLNKERYPIWRVLKTNKELLDPHNKIFPKEGHVLEYYISPEAARVCKSRGGRTHFYLNPNIRHENTTQEPEIDEFGDEKRSKDDKSLAGGLNKELRKEGFNVGG